EFLDALVHGLHPLATLREVLDRKRREVDLDPDRARPDSPALARDRVLIQRLEQRLPGEAAQFPAAFRVADVAHDAASLVQALQACEVAVRVGECRTLTVQAV